MKPIIKVILVPFAYFIINLPHLIYCQNNYLPLAGEITNPSGNYIGSQYFIGEWLDGDVRLANGEIVRNNKLRYNGYLDEVFWLHEKSMQQVMLDRSLIQEFIIYPSGGSKPLKFRKIEISSTWISGKRECIAQVLHEGHISLYSFRRIAAAGEVVRIVDEGRFGFTRLEPDHLNFIGLPGNRMVRITQSGRRGIYRAFPEKRKEIRRILISSRNSLRTEEDLIKAVRMIELALFTEEEPPDDQNK